MAYRFPGHVSKTGKHRKSPWPKGYCPIPMEKRFQKGVVQQPNGRPTQSDTIKSILDKLGGQEAAPKIIEEMKKTFPNLKNPMTMREAILAKAYCIALEKNGWAYEFIAERTEGKVDQTVRVGDANKPRTPLTDEELAQIGKSLECQSQPKL